MKNKSQSVNEISQNFVLLNFVRTLRLLEHPNRVQREPPLQNVDGNKTSTSQNVDIKKLRHSKTSKTKRGHYTIESGIFLKRKHVRFPY
jgi:hypothetical protein